MLVKQIKSSKLELKLLFKVIRNGLFCILLYIFLINMTVYYIDHLHVDINTYKEQLKQTTEDFQNYITESNISIRDTKGINSWDRKQNLLHIKLVESNRIIYDSLDYISRLRPKVSYIYYEPEKDFSNIITFKDGEATLYITILYKQRIEQRLDYIIGLLCVFLFFFSIFNEFKKLVRDIIDIKKGIQILEGGNLSYVIKSNRNDEITDLADSINRMSKELDFKRKEEELFRQKNYDLVTSISHDIRTPLTTVNSYIDLILEKKYSNLSELEYYLVKIKEKSILINDLTDNLFTHFLNQNKDYKYNFEVVIGNDFLVYLLKNMEEGLHDKGYDIHLDFDFQEDFFLKVDVMQLHRVFNNLEGNLIKYASRYKPILYSAILINNTVKITGKNYILNNPHYDSHGIGIINCQEIIKLHLGEMNTFIEGDYFYVVINIPAYILV